jgi:hypothetical protein
LLEKLDLKKGEQFAAVEDSNKPCSKVGTARMICTIYSLLLRNGDLKPDPLNPWLKTQRRERLR